MKLQFYKYHGTGNDFVVIDNRQLILDKNNTKMISDLCNRRFGIGADGLILLEDHDQYDFRMIYFNADGNESSMCGNGGRCIAHFAKYLGVIDNSATFTAIDGVHHALIKDDHIHLQMQDVIQVKDFEDYVFLDTGSPHFIKVVDAIDSLNVDQEGAKIRYSDVFADKGINVNFIKQDENDKFSVRTYERGVEAETLSCGTGVTAAAIAMHFTGQTEDSIIYLTTKGGNLKVTFSRTNDIYTDVWLIGPAVQVFKGEWQL